MAAATVAGGGYLRFSLSGGTSITGWNRALERPLAIEVAKVPLQAAAPRAIQIPIRHAPIRVRSFDFPEPSEVEVRKRDACTTDLPSTAVAPGKSPADGGSLKLNVTRIRPPDNVIKLEDRLNYFLQPPLEALLTDRELAMPFRPFPFQFEGVAFLFPRHAAILADEMGWERPCRPSRRFASCSAAARSAAS